MGSETLGGRDDYVDVSRECQIVAIIALHVNDSTARQPQEAHQPRCRTAVNLLEDHDAYALSKNFEGYPKRVFPLQLSCEFSRRTEQEVSVRPLPA